MSRSSPRVMKPWYVRRNAVKFSDAFRLLHRYSTRPYGVPARASTLSPFMASFTPSSSMSSPVVSRRSLSSFSSPSRLMSSLSGKYEGALGIIIAEDSLMSLMIVDESMMVELLSMREAGRRAYWGVWAGVEGDMTSGLMPRTEAELQDRLVRESDGRTASLSSVPMRCRIIFVSLNESGSTFFCWGFSCLFSSNRESCSSRACFLSKSELIA
mmetsp:Transcript_27935/g.70081  ORF Transcript_27935/g.70081 Transcript_27935/m.70081 type:complete len:213 (-) Transcript_27935:438-1076(-)